MKPYLLFLCTSLWLGTSFASQKPFVTHLTRNQYQAAHQNWAACQDEKGVMYFGNGDGLLESDGREWRLHRLPGSPAIQGVAVSSHKTIFTGGPGEMGRWDKDLSGTLKYTSLKGLVKEGNPDKEDIQQVWIADNKVYFQSPHLIYVYNFQNIQCIIPEADFLFLLKVQGTYWVQLSTGLLYRLQGEKLEKVEGSDFFQKSTIRAILPHGLHNYLIGLSTGEIYLYDEKGFTLWNQKLSRELTGRELSCGIYSPQHGNYYFGTLYNGLYEVAPDGTVKNHFASGNGPEPNAIRSLYEDQRHNIWAVQDKGLSYLRYADDLSYFLTKNHEAGTIHAATYWGDYLLLATNQGVFYAPKSQLDDRDFFASLQLIQGTQGEAWSFATNGGTLFCAHSNGLLSIDQNLNAAHPYAITSGVRKVVAARLKGRNLLLLATYDQPIIIDMESGQMHAITQVTGPICDIETDYLENIWMETDKRGIYKCRMDKEGKINATTYYGHGSQTSLPSSLHMDKVGKRLIFVGDNRFYTYREDSDTLVPNQPLNECFKPARDIKRLIHSHDEENWMVDGSSIHRFVYDGSQARILGSYALKSDNLSLAAGEGISILNDSTSLICLDNGFILFRNRLHLPASLFLPIPYIEAVEIKAPGKESLYPDLKREGDIPYNYNSVSLDYSVGNMHAGNWQVECLLQNKQMDNIWRVRRRRNEITYDRLPPGQYVFRLRTTDGMGHYSPEARYSFRVLPPWYRTPWAYAGYGGAALALSYLIIFLNSRRYRRLNQQQIRQTETRHLLQANRKLKDEIEEKNAELFTQTSFIVRKNELILRLREMVDEWYRKTNQKSLLPLYQKMNQLLNDSIDEEEDWKMFLIKFEQKHQHFFKHLKEKYPELTHNDLRLCACLKLNLETKDIASLMNLSVRGVENNRYRLRKKLGLSTEQSLNEYFLSVE